MNRAIVSMVGSLLANILIIFGLTVTLSLDAAAQQATELTLEEIIVTATRRETDVQSTAASITAVSGKQLADFGKVDIMSFLDAVPGVTMSYEGGGNNRVIFRNVASSAQELGSATSATYFDDFAVGNVSGPGGSPDLRLVDIDRVEVLKGPQGTLFGRSAMGGIVRYISNKPDTDGFEGGFGGFVSDTTDGGSNYSGQGYLNLPVNEVLAIRVAAYSYQYDGYIDNIELGVENFNDEDTVGGRFALHWDATDSLSIDLTYLSQSIDGAQSQVTTTRDPGDLNVAGDEGPDISYDVNARTMIAGVLGDWSPSYNIVNLNLNYDFDSFTTTFLVTRTDSELDFTFDDREFVGIRSGAIPGTGQPSFDNETDTLELRLVSTNEGMLDWIVGLYYEDSDADSRINNTYRGPDQLLFGFFPLTDGILAIDNELELTGHEEAIYGELGFSFSPDTRFLLGYRYSDVEFGSLQTRADGFFNLLQGFDQLVGIPFDTRENVSTYKISIEHSFSDDVFGYALASSGYRRGGFNPPTAISAFSTFDSDSLWNYEFGVKTTWLDGRLVANLAVYYLDWDEIQLVVQDPITFARETQNVGKASVTGAEFNVDYLANENWRFSFGGSLSDPQLEEDVPPSIDPFTGAQVFTGRNGDRLPGSATESFFLTATYDKSINESLGLFASVFSRYVGDRLNDFNTSLDVKLPSYSLTDLRLGFNHNNGWSIAMFADNVFDEAAEFFIDRQGPFFERVPTNRPRTVGLNFTYAYR